MPFSCGEVGEFVFVVVGGGVGVGIAVAVDDDGGCSDVVVVEKKNLGGF